MTVTRLDMGNDCGGEYEHCHMRESPRGDYVEYLEYAELERENAELRLDIGDLESENGDLKSELDVLRKLYNES